MDNYYEIIPRLYLGSVETSNDFEEIKRRNISVIINCTKDIDNKFELRLLKPIEEAPEDVRFWLIQNSYYIKYFRIPVDDNGDEKEVDNFYKYVMEILPEIYRLYKYGKTILVHCLAGNQRSVAFVCAFLMYYDKLVFEEAVGLLLHKKPNVFYFGERINFKDALLRIEGEILDGKINCPKLNLFIRNKNYNMCSSIFSKSL